MDNAQSFTFLSSLNKPIKQYRMRLVHVEILLLFFQGLLRFSVSDCDVTDFGAIGDGERDDTVAIQSAISDETCSSVIFPKELYIAN